MKYNPKQNGCIFIGSRCIHELLQVITIHVICQSDINKKRKNANKQNLTVSHKNDLSKLTNTKLEN